MSCRATMNTHTWSLTALANILQSRSADTAKTRYIYASVPPCPFQDGSKPSEFRIQTPDRHPRGRGHYLHKIFQLKSSLNVHNPYISYKAHQRQLAPEVRLLVQALKPVWGRSRSRAGLKWNGDARGREEEGWIYVECRAVYSLSCRFAQS